MNQCESKHKVYVNNFTDEDLEIIRRQLNCSEVDLCAVIERCIYNYPQIILMNPISRNEEGKSELNHQAASNLLWLTCPYLNDKIHEIENKGFISKISKLINNDTGFTNRMRYAHAHFYFLRHRVCYVSGGFRNLDIELFGKGIGGIQDLNSLKCLHLHYSHYRICSNNIAGLIVCRLLDYKLQCDNCECRKLHDNL